MPEEIVGKVSHFFAQPVVVGIEMSGVLKVGDQIRVKGQGPFEKRQVVIDGGAISELSTTIDANFARRSEIDDRAHPEFIDDAISPLGGQAMQGIAAK